MHIHSLPSKQTNAFARDLLSVKDNSKKLKFITNFDEELHYALDESVETASHFYNTYMADDVFKTVDFSVELLDDGARAFARGTDSIHLTSGYVSETAVHEMGHIIQDSNYKLADTVREFFAVRVDGEDLVTMYKSEVAKKDKFLNPYQGRIYDWEDIDHANGTELLS